MYWKMSCIDLTRFRFHHFPYALKNNSCIFLCTCKIFHPHRTESSQINTSLICLLLNLHLKHQCHPSRTVFTARGNTPLMPPCTCSKSVRHTAMDLQSTFSGPASLLSPSALARLMWWAILYHSSPCIVRSGPQQRRGDRPQSPPLNSSSSWPSASSVKQTSLVSPSRHTHIKTQPERRSPHALRCWEKRWGSQALVFMGLAFLLLRTDTLDDPGIARTSPNLLSSL